MKGLYRTLPTMGTEMSSENKKTLELSVDSCSLDLSEYAQELIKQLETGDSTSALRTIDDIVRARDNHLFLEVGRLTRSLHTALKNFQVESADSEGKDEKCRIADATDRLNFVITKTETAANKTMDMVEDTIPISKELGESALALQGEWQRLMTREMTGEEFRSLYKQMDDFLGFTAEKTKKIDGNLSDILLAQDFQDLTGQVIKKVMRLVKEVEANLVNLVKMASTIQSLSGIEQDEEAQAKENEELKKKLNEFDDGPCVNKSEREDVMANQDDVDDLLSSLGF